MSILIETTLGDLVIDLYTKERPRTCLNFLKLCKTKRYNCTLFYYIQQNFIAQSGDPTNTGRGGVSIFEQLYGEQAGYFEMESMPKLKHLKRGTVSMVNNGENLHGSQFFITLAENLDYLDEKHTVFGQIAEGFDTLEKLNEAICDDAHRPYRDIWINHTIVLDDPYADPKGLDIPARSPSPPVELLKHTRIAADEEIDDTLGKTEEEVREDMETKEATARAHILEMIGDIHYAEERPPDNVLFVCKLNPVTTEDDLGIIFGRFGKITSCEIIRDQKTGNSLQYAFIEFEKPQECETAYFKMDNVLIDDRRIHVDFSQSVAKNYSWKRELTSAATKGKLGDGRTSDKEKKEERKLVQEPPAARRNRSRSPHYHRSSRPADDHRGVGRGRRESPRRDRRASPGRSRTDHRNHSSPARRKERRPASPPRYSSHRSKEKRRRP